MEFYKRFDIYWQMIVILVVLAAFGIYKYGIENTVPQLLLAVSVAAGSDFLIKNFLFKIKIFPKSAIISGLFIGTLLNIGIAWYVPVTASLFAILTKNFIKYKKINIFNPAAVGVFMALVFFPNSNVWWAGEQLIPIALLGLWTIYRVKRIQMVTIFLATYILISVIYNYSSFSVSTLQNILTNSTLLFFAFFMLTEHKTNPFTTKSRMIYAPLAAIISFASLILWPQYNFIFGLVISNMLSVLLNKFTLQQKFHRQQL